MSFRPLLESLERRDLCAVQALSPAMLRVFEDMPVKVLGQPFNAEAGKGITIGVVDAYADPNVGAELATFDARYHLPTASLSVVNQGTEQDPAAQWPIERSLDVLEIHAMLPAAHVLVVNAVDSSGINILNAVNYAENHANVVSCSFGTPAFLGDSSLGFFFQPADPTARVATVVSSGDSGPGVPEWPSDLNQTRPPTVLSAGGTTANSGPKGQYLGERMWSGSGPSGNLVADADPNSGVPIYVISARHPHGVWFQVGGTSLSAPLISAEVGLADQLRRAKHLPFLTTTDVIVATRHMPAADRHSGHGLSGAGSLIVGKAALYLASAKPQPIVQEVHQSPVKAPGSVSPFVTEFS